MRQFIESIRLFDGTLHNIDLHQMRADRTTLHFFGTRIDLRSISIPPAFRRGLYKCRVVYDHEIRTTEFLPYHPQARKTVKLVHADSLRYDYKHLDRTPISQLLNDAQTDDIVIVRNNLLTDSAIANLVFENADGLFTPTTPLLQGTQRQLLIEQCQIQPTDITPEQMTDYQWVHFVNAMQPLGSAQPFPVSQITR